MPLIQTTTAQSSGNTASVKEVDVAVSGVEPSTSATPYAYFGVNDSSRPAPGGMVAVALKTGERAWHTPPEKPLCGAPSRDCNAAQGAAVTVIPGAVLSGSYDGGLRAYAADDGTVLWQFDTNREFTTVNGIKANGGSMDGPGPIVAGGLLFVNSGYGGIAGRPGNVLLVFGTE
jgi:polyvinyl alcohol dehydrogenase (cytochrome)